MVVCSVGHKSDLNKQLAPLRGAFSFCSTPLATAEHRLFLPDALELLDRAYPQLGFDTQTRGGGAQIDIALLGLFAR